jgi:integrase
VTAEERKFGGAVRLKSYDPRIQGYVTRSLKFSVRDAEGTLIEEAVDRAKSAAADLVNALIKGDAILRKTTMKELVRAFTRDELPGMKERYRKAVKRELDLLEAFFAKAYHLEDLTPREWNALARQRASGEINSSGEAVTDPKDRRPVGARTVAITLKTLRQLCRWGAAARRSNGSFLLSQDPTRGLKVPSEKNPRREWLDDAEFEAMVEAADKVHPFMRTLLLIAGETGRRIGAIVALRYSDWLPDVGSYGALRWRADSDKLGREWVAPLTPRLRSELQRLLRERPGIGDTPMFPAPASEGPVDVWLATKWWKRTEKEAGVPRRKGQGWHSLRRRFATARKHLPLRDVAHMGGWKGTHVLANIYQQPDMDTMEQVATGARELRRRVRN